MTETAARRDSSSDQAYIRQILARRPIFFVFPPEMEADFLEKRVESSLFYIRSGQWLLLAMFLAIIAVGMVYFHDVMMANNFQLLKFVQAPVGAAILFIIYGPLIPIVRKNFHRVMFPISVLQIIAIQQHIFMSAGTGYYIYAIFNQMITMLLVALGLRFATPVLLVHYVLCALSSLAIGALLGFPVDLLAFNYYFILYGTVIIALAGISERQERFAFLQELLVSYQSEELAKLNHRLDKIAHEDALTGIANRRSFDDFAAREWERAYREQRTLSLLLLDVDYFKRYNDTYGHEGGDKCLQEIARTIREALMRPADLAARYGGEEFAVLLPDTQLRGATMVAERIIRWVDGRHILHAGSTVAPHVTVSIGLVTLIPEPGQTLREAIKRADEALYQAKGNGRHQYRIYHASDLEAIEA